ncbi:MAG TPA: hypothetical protein VKQ07_01080 [Jatrophihabitantaceae bacterium]|nr:hypothetical protein [Jatrophihabitantaceae bacterium]
MITRLVGRRAGLQGLVWGAVFGLFTYASAVGFAASYRTPQARAVFAAALGSNSGLTMMLGRAHRIDTVAGFTEWRGVGLLALVAGVWGALTGTRLLRGEEEAGRWELLVSGMVTRRRAAVFASAGLGIGWLAMFVMTFAITGLTRSTTQLNVSLGAAGAYAFVLAASAAMFLATGVLASQLARSRRHAAMIAGGVLGASVVLRMLSDSGGSMRWLAWVSPLGWLEKTRPLTGFRPALLLLVAAAVAGQLAIAWWWAGTRDIGAGLLERPDVSVPHLRLLSGPAGLAIRTTRPVALGWCAGLAVLGMLFGLVAKSAAQAAAGSSAFRRTIGELGAVGNGATAYLGITFLVGATLVMMVAAGRVVDVRDEEGTGRVEHLLVRPVSRLTWFVQRMALSLALLVACAEVLALAEWTGASVQHTGVGLGRLLAAGVNVVPVAVAVLGLGALVFGVAPRWTAVVTYGLVAWSFLVDFLAQLVSSLHWMRGTSLLYHMVPAPAAGPHWVSAAGLLGIGTAAAAIGFLAFARRDVLGE